MPCGCKNQYKRRGDVAVRCRAIEGDMDYCGHQYHCPNTGQWEVNCTGSSCTYRRKPFVKDKEGNPLPETKE